MQTRSFGEAAGLQPLSAPRVATETETIARRDHPLWTWGLMGLLAAGLISFVSWAARAQLFTPFGDDYAWLDIALHQNGGFTAAYLFTPHNGQVIAWARALAWLGRRHGETGEFLAAGVAAIIAEVLALTLAVVRFTPGRAFGVALAVVTGLLVLDGVAEQDAAFAVFSVYTFVAAFAALSLVLFELRTPGRLASFGLWASLACAAGASLGNAAGFVIWPVLVWMALRAREDQRIVVLLVVAAAAAIACGFPGMTLGQATGTHTAGLARLVKMVRYFGGYCGLPWSGGSAHLAQEVAGWLVAAAAVWLALGPRRESDAFARLAGLGSGMIAFGLITALMASFGRVDELPTPVVPTRYAVFADLLHVGMVLVAARWLSQIWDQRPVAARASILLLCLLLLGAEQATAVRVARLADRINAASRAFDRGDRSKAVIALTYPRPDVAVRIRKELSRSP